MRRPIGSIWSNNSSAIFWLTTTTVLAAPSSTSVKERPGDTSPPATLGQAALRPWIWTFRWVFAPKTTSPCPLSSRAVHATEGRAAIAVASSIEIGGLRRHGLISSEPSEMFTPPWKNRPTQNVLGPDCSSMSAMPLLNPEITAPMTITTITPMATPRMVRAARTLWARSEVSAMLAPSSRGVMESLLAQRHDRVEPGRAAGRIHAGRDADAAAQHDAEQDGDRRHRGRQRGRDVEEHREEYARGDPQTGPDHRDRHRFGEELPQDVAAPRAQRLADPDLTCALGDRHQHDVHDDDAAHDQGDPHEPRPDGVEDAAELVPERQHPLRRLHDEIVVLARAQVAAGAHHRLRLVHRLAHFVGRVRLDDESVHHPGRGHFPLNRRQGGGHDELVERDAEQVALPLHHADHPVGDAVDADGAVDRIGAREQLLGQIVTQDHYRGARLRLLGAERPALLDLQIHDVEVALGGSLERDVLRDLAVVLNGPAVFRIPRRDHRHGEPGRHCLG